MSDETVKDTHKKCNEHKEGQHIQTDRDRQTDRQTQTHRNTHRRSTVQAQFMMTAEWVSVKIINSIIHTMSVVRLFHSATDSPLRRFHSDLNKQTTGDTQWYNKPHNIKCIYEVWNVCKWATGDELRPMLITVPSNPLIVIANYTNLPGISIKFQGISSISRSCRQPENELVNATSSNQVVNDSAWHFHDTRIFRCYVSIRHTAPIC